METVVGTYLLLVFLSLLYIKVGGQTSNHKKAYIILLSGSNKYITRFRIKQVVSLSRNRRATVILCGKELANFMKQELEDCGINNVLLQDKSTNTEEDAKFLKKDYISTGDVKLILVSSLSHQRRVYHTFLKYFDSSQLVNSPAWSEIFSYYSPLLPTGWFAVLLNAYKDYKYNKRFV